MSIMERIFQIDQILEGRNFVTKDELLEKLGISWATLKRDLTYMKDRLNAPIVFDRELGGYRFERDTRQTGPKYELPGLWFSAEEIHALLTMQHLLHNLDSGGLLGPHIKPLLARLTGLLDTGDHSPDEVQHRVKIITQGARQFHLDQFQVVGSSLLNRKRIILHYHARGTNETTIREVSPLRLVYYRDNWSLDAWCHLRDGLRAFSVDAIKQAELTDKPAKEVSDKRLDEVLGSGYGIFSGEKIQWATLRFTPERARWVASESWHPAQKGKFLKDGCYELKIPYADDRELLMDILKFGADCQVTSPASLRDKVVRELQRGLNQYSD